MTCNDCMQEIDKWRPLRAVCAYCTREFGLTRRGHFPSHPETPRRTRRPGPTCRGYDKFPVWGHNLCKTRGGCGCQHQRKESRS